MSICKFCKREYDPSKEFIEEVELLEALDRYVNIDIYCPDCLRSLDDALAEVADAFVAN